MYTLTQLRKLAGQKGYYTKTVCRKKYLYKYMGCVNGVKTEKYLGGLDDPPVYRSLFDRLTPAQRRRARTKYAKGLSAREVREYVNSHLVGDHVSLQQMYNFLNKEG